MPGENSFDMEAAVGEIGSGLGLELGQEQPDEDDVVTDADEGKPAEQLPTPDTSPAPQPTPAVPTPTPAPGPDLNTPPRTWTQAAAAKWAAVDPDIRAEIMKREDDMFRGLEQYKSMAAKGKELDGLVAPYLSLMQQANVQPQQVISGLLRAHAALVTGTPEVRAQLLRQLAKDYDISLGDEPYVDPAVKSLQTSVQALQSERSAEKAAQAEARASELRKELDAFASDPKNLYFNEVAEDMVPFLKSGLSLAQAYEKATWANPATRAKEQSRLQAEATAKAQKEAEEHAAAARKAQSGNVRSRAKSGGAAAPLGSMDETLQATLKGIRSRED